MPSLRSRASVIALGFGLFTPALLVLVGCSEPPSPPSGYNLILINIDTLRADHLGCYGYARNTSPFFDSLCRDGVVFERANANSSYTRESVSALFTGQLPSTSGSLGWHAAPTDAASTLAEILADAGYRTGFFSNTVMLRPAGFTRGFETVQHLSKQWSVSGEGLRLTERVLAHIEEISAEPFFLYVHYLDPHGPYRPGRAALAAVDARTVDSPLALYDDVSRDLPALRADGFGPGEDRFEDLVTRYDAEIRTTDTALRILFEGLGRSGVLPRTLVVITADHGEEFLEHEYIEHGWTLYDEVLRVPLLFFAPEFLRPGRTRVRASHVDVAPTLLGLLGIEREIAAADGHPLFTRGPDGLALVESDRTQIAELVMPRRQIVRAVLRGNWKYIATIRRVDPDQRGRDSASTEVPADFDPWGPVVREELFDLGRDPGERNDRLLDAADDEAERVRASLSEHLVDLRRRAVASSPLRDGMGTREVPAEDRAHLEALGYLDAREDD